MSDLGGIVDLLRYFVIVCLCIYELHQAKRALIASAASRGPDQPARETMSPISRIIASCIITLLYFLYSCILS